MHANIRTLFRHPLRPFFVAPTNLPTTQHLNPHRRFLVSLDPVSVCCVRPKGLLRESRRRRDRRLPPFTLRLAQICPVSKGLQKVSSIDIPALGEDFWMLIRVSTGGTSSCGNSRSAGKHGTTASLHGIGSALDRAGVCWRGSSITRQLSYLHVVAEITPGKYVVSYSTSS